MSRAPKSITTAQLWMMFKKLYDEAAAVAWEIELREREERGDHGS